MNETVHSRSKAKEGRLTSRTNNPDRTRENIIEVATREFSEKGLAGARVDVIADTTHTSKRMIYYYFGSKEGLYIAVLEAAYSRIRQIESELHLHDLEPEQALRTLVAFTVDYHHANPEFVRLVMSENMQRGEFLAQSATIQQRNEPAIEAITAVYQRGVAAGVFRSGLDPVDLHMSISGLSFFNVANSHTFALIFQYTLDSPDAIRQRCANVVEMVLRYVKA
jgi:AcrR family transcriptional regulator